MNTFGILPTSIRSSCLTEMFLCAGSGGKVVIGCWHKDSLPVGFREFYSKNPELCGACTESDFDYEHGDFVCSSSDYTSHWWSEEELSQTLRDSFLGNPKDLQIDFQLIGVGIFAICSLN